MQNGYTGMQANYSIGDAMTYEQMIKSKVTDGEIINPFSMSDTINPYLFEDTPVGHRSFAVVSAVGENLQQKHESGKMMLKVRCTSVDSESAMKMADEVFSRDDKFAVYVVEMFKFFCMPPPMMVAAADMDKAMNDAIADEYGAAAKRHSAFNERKKELLDEVERHNNIAHQIAENQLSTDKAESAPKIVDDFLKDYTETKRCAAAATVTATCQETDIAMCSDNFIVLASLALTETEETERLPPNTCILKICGSFNTVEDADKHATSLKSSIRYKMFDITVCSMYSWLQIPPPYELIDNVVYESKKLTEALGKRKQKIDITSRELNEEFVQ